MPTPITPAMITALMTGYRSDFQAGMSMAPSQYKKIAMTVPSTSKSNTYGWLGSSRSSVSGSAPASSRR